MEHPLPLLILAVVALLTVVRVLRRNRSAAGQAAAAIIIGGSVVVGVLVQTTDFIDDGLEAPGLIGLSLVLALAAVVIPWRRSPAPPT